MKSGSEAPILSYGGYKNACERKKKYISFDEAKVVAKRVRKTVKARVKPYACYHCKGWHIGHFSKRKQQLAVERFHLSTAVPGVTEAHLIVDSGVL